MCGRLFAVELESGSAEVAKQEIESHIAQRTGSASTLIDRDLDFAANGTDVLENGEEDTIM